MLINTRTHISSSVFFTATFRSKRKSD